MSSEHIFHTNGGFGLAEAVGSVSEQNIAEFSQQLADLNFLIIDIAACTKFSMDAINAIAQLGVELRRRNGDLVFVANFKTKIYRNLMYQSVFEVWNVHSTHEAAEADFALSQNRPDLQWSMENSRW